MRARVRGGRACCVATRGATLLLLLLRSCVSRRLARPYCCDAGRACGCAFFSLASGWEWWLLTTAYLVFDSLHPGLSPSVARVSVVCLFIPALPRSDIYLLRWLRALDYYIQRRIIIDIYYMAVEEKSRHRAKEKPRSTTLMTAQE